MSCKNVQILNFNHNIVEVGPDNKIVITDQIKCNSITIPQPVTNILQINSPGPQGITGPQGEQGIQGTANTGGNIGTIQYNNSNNFDGVSTLTYDGSSLVTATNINATGSFSGSFTENIVTGIILYGPIYGFDYYITSPGIYLIQLGSGNGGLDTYSMFFPDPSGFIGCKITIINNNGQLTILGSSYYPKNLRGANIETIPAYTAEQYISNGTDWIRITSITD